MNAQILDGKALAAQILEDVRARLKNSDTVPHLHVILVGDNPASKIYVGAKQKKAESLGITTSLHHLPAQSNYEDVAELIDYLNQDNATTHILMQLPLPAHIRSHTNALINRIVPAKDVDGLTAVNQGLLVQGDPKMIPCTPQGVMRLIRHARKDLSGLNALVIGRSLLFGKPMMQLLLHENCTVTAAHSRTSDLERHARAADILIAATGQPKMITADMVKPGAIVIDVGINRMDDGAICGDVDFHTIKDIAGAITPVPGGVGPMTIACLMENCTD